MIPAILSCFFVVYLYHSLNVESKADSGASAVNSTLEERLESLTARVQKLSQIAATSSENQGSGNS